MDEHSISNRTVAEFESRCWHNFLFNISGYKKEGFPGSKTVIAGTETKTNFTMGSKGRISFGVDSANHHEERDSPDNTTSYAFFCVRVVPTE